MRVQASCPLAVTTLQIVSRTPGVIYLPQYRKVRRHSEGEVRVHI